MNDTWLATAAYSAAVLIPQFVRYRYAPLLFGIGGFVAVAGLLGVCDALGPRPSAYRETLLLATFMACYGVAFGAIIKTIVSDFFRLTMVRYWLATLAAGAFFWLFAAGLTAFAIEVIQY